MQYFKEKAQPLIHHLDINISDNEAEYDKKLMGYLNQNPNIQIIYVPNSRAYKIASILKKHERKDIMVIGFDTLKENIEYLKDGYIDYLFGQQSKSQGYKAVMLMFNALFRKEKITPHQYLPIDILNKENIDFYEGLME